MTARFVPKEIGSDLWMVAGLLALGIAAPAIADDSVDADRLVAQAVVPQKQAEAGRDACFREPTSGCVILQALGSMKGISDARVLAHALRSIAEAQAEALGSIAGAQAKAGDMAGALKTTESITDIDDRGSALSAIADARAEAGDIAGALKTTESITNANHRNRAQYWIARFQIDAGDIAGALNTAEGIARLRTH